MESVATKPKRELTAAEKMTWLAEMFPTLREADGVRPWNQKKFARWATNADLDAARYAAAFVLSVWNGLTPSDGGWWNQKDYSVGKFDPVLAMGYWDHAHQKAFIQWCCAPFWP